MKPISAWILIIALAGCTTMRPVDGSPTEVRQLINSGALLEAGDRVRIVTADQKTHRFAITRVEAGLIEGPHDSVPVDQVTSLEVESTHSPAWKPFDLKSATIWAIAVVGYGLKPPTVNATPDLSR